jgi:thiosulfate/3-mercaptopyruvate sulfurtransferase
VTEISIDELATRLGEVAVVDVRATHEYDGTGGAQCDPRQGHIPGARHLDIYRLMELPPDAVQEVLGLEDGAEVVVYCHSGSRSAIAMQILRSLGYDARNYAGSWHEWSRRDDLPAESSEV